MSANEHEALEQVIMEFLKDNCEAETMDFTAFHESINQIHPCERVELSVTVTLMSLLGKVHITKDELGRGRGFALAAESQITL